MNELSNEGGSAEVPSAALVADALRLDYPVYHQSPRMGWGGYSRRVSVLSSLTASDGKRLLRRFMPSASAQEHRGLAKGHRALAQEHRLAWARIADEAAVVTFGRAFQITDYRVSAIACEEFADVHKEALRVHARSASMHDHLALCHLMAAGHKQEVALRLLRAKEQ